MQLQKSRKPEQQAITQKYKKKMEEYKMASEKIQKFIDDVKALTVLELSLIHI